MQDNQSIEPKEPLNVVEIPFSTFYAGTLSIFTAIFLGKTFSQWPLMHPSLSSFSLETTGFIVRVNAFLGIILVIAGYILYLIAIHQLHLYKTTTSYGEPIKTLVTTGIYSITRNPFFVAMVMMSLGTAAFTNSAASLAPLLFFVVYLQMIVIPREEAVLRRMYGKDYQRYCSRVPRWLVW